MSDFAVPRPTLFHPDRTLDVLEMAHRAIDVAVRRYKPVAVFGMFSGGHDSLCATHIASQHPAFTAAVHLNTGIGVEQTRAFVRSTADALGWPLLEYHAKDEGQDYDAIVLEHGFPGPYGHRFMYTRLKERPLRRLMREHSGGNVLLVNGARRAESTRRAGNVRRVFQKEGRKVWVAPLAEWEATHKNRYIATRDLPRNEVSDMMHMSGECLCGAYAHPGELAEWEYFGYTDAVERIKALERRAESMGVHCRWGTPPPDDGAHEDQLEWSPLCASCEYQHKKAA